MMKRCGFRQRKCDGFESQQFRLVVETLPVMLQVSPILLGGEICLHMWSIKTSITYVPIAFSALVPVAYSWFFILGESSFESPYQTPLSIILRHMVIPAVARSKRVLSRTYWGTKQGHHHQPPPTQLNNILVQQPRPWWRRRDLAWILWANADDTRCASWILRNPTSSEVLDTAIKFAPTIIWFNVHGLDVIPQYELIISTLQACFDSAGKLNPSLRDRAYYSVQAILWIHIRAACVSVQFSRRFPLPDFHYNTKSLDIDLAHLLGICASRDTDEILTQMYHIAPGFTPAHLQWTSNALLHLARTMPQTSGVFDLAVGRRSVGDWSVIPLDAALNRLLTWCIFLGSRVDEEVLEIQDKSCVIHA